MTHIDVADRVQPAQVDDDVTSDRATRHATPRSSRDQGDPAIAGPSHDLRDIVRIRWNGDAGWHRARDPGTF
jgi:hypothetical protein